MGGEGSGVTVAVATPGAPSFIRQIFSAWSSTHRRRVIFGAVVGGLSLLTLGNMATQRGAKKRRRKAAEAAAAAAAAAAASAADSDAATSGKKKKRKHTLLQVLRLSPTRSAATRWAALLTASVVAKLLVGTQVNAEIGRMGGLLVAREWEELYTEQGVFLLWCLPYSLLKGAVTWSRQRLALCLRAGIAGALSERYLAVSCGGVTATLRDCADPDARLTADVERMTATCAATLEQWVASATEIVVKNGQLASRMGAAPLARFYASMVGVYAWMRLAVPSTKGLVLDERAAESILAEQHAAVRAHAEEIDLLRGGAPERAMLAASLTRVERAVAARANSELRAAVPRSFVTRHVSVFLGKRPDYRYTLRESFFSQFDSRTPPYTSLTRTGLCAMIPAVFDSARAASADGAGVAHVTEYFLSALHMMVDVAMGVAKFFKSLGPLGEGAFVFTVTF